MQTMFSRENRYNDLIDCLNKVEALLTVAMSVDVTEVKPDVALNYLWAITDITQQARSITERLFADEQVKTKQ